MTSERIAVPGGELYVEIDGDGPPVVLIHAGVANLRMWDPQVPALSQRYRVIRFDTCSYGKTGTEQVEFSQTFTCDGFCQRPLPSGPATASTVTLGDTSRRIRRFLLPFRHRPPPDASSPRRIAAQPAVWPVSDGRRSSGLVLKRTGRTPTLLLQRTGKQRRSKR